MLIRPLPFADADRLVKLWENHPGYSRVELSPPNYRDWKNMSHSFENLAAFTSISHNLVGRGEPERVEGLNATAGLFPMLGTQPCLGRVFTAEEEQPNAARTLVLSYGAAVGNLLAQPHDECGAGGQGQNRHQTESDSRIDTRPCLVRMAAIPIDCRAPRTMVI